MDNIQENLQPEQRKMSKEVVINIILAVLCVVCVVAITLRLFVFVKFEVDQESMYPTYYDGEYVWVNKTIPAQRGNVVVFRSSEEGKMLIKRIVALEGDKVYLQRNGDDYTVVIWCADTQEIVLEDYYTRGDKAIEIPLFSNAGILENCDSLDNSYTVPQGGMFVLGDNRPISLDSRSFGAVSLDQYIGTAIT